MTRPIFGTGSTQKVLEETTKRMQLIAKPVSLMMERVQEVALPVLSQVEQRWEEKEEGALQALLKEMKSLGTRERSVEWVKKPLEEANFKADEGVSQTLYLEELSKLQAMLLSCVEMIQKVAEKKILCLCEGLYKKIYEIPEGEERIGELRKGLLVIDGAIEGMGKRLSPSLQKVIQGKLSHWVQEEAKRFVCYHLEETQRELKEVMGEQEGEREECSMESLLKAKIQLTLAQRALGAFNDLDATLLMMHLYQEGREGEESVRDGITKVPTALNSQLAKISDRIHDALARSIEADYGFIRVKGDGNCLFGSIGAHVLGSSLRHREVRNSIVDYMRQFSEEFEEEIWMSGEGWLRETMEQHLANMSRNTVWGGTPEIRAAAEVWRRPILILQHPKGGGLKLSEVFLPSRREGDLFFDPIVLEFEQAGNLSCHHYNTWLPKAFVEKEEDRIQASLKKIGLPQKRKRRKELTSEERERRELFEGDKWPFWTQMK